MNLSRLGNRILFFCILACCGGAAPTRAQSNAYARNFFRSKQAVEEAMQDLKISVGQKLPILEGFVAATEQPLDRYERGFYQFSTEIIPGDNGATIVSLRAKITAWYADRDVAKSGYQVLPSNGRLELDMLDRIEEKLTGKRIRSAADGGVESPRPKLDLSGAGMAATNGPRDSSPPTDEVSEMRAQRLAREKRVQQLTDQLQNLQEIKRTQAHPQNLVIVKKSPTPVYSRGSASSRLLFEASEKDEFEFLDGDSEWIHVTISGDSRGYLQRSALELSAHLTEKLQSATVTDPLEKFAAFRLEREEVSTFPGNWENLKGKNVKIYTVQVVSTNPKETSPGARLAYTFALFEKGLKEAASTAPPADGVVVIFDAADGGIAGATLAEIQKASTKAITREAFWAESYLDPPEAFLPPAK